MPIYEYICKDCDKLFEKMILSSQDNEVECPSCSGRKVEKQFSTFSAHGSPSPNFEMSNGGGCPAAMGGGCPSGGCHMPH